MASARRTPYLVPPGNGPHEFKLPSLKDLIFSYRSPVSRGPSTVQDPPAPSVDTSTSFDHAALAYQPPRGDWSRPSSTSVSTPSSVHQTPHSPQQHEHSQHLSQHQQSPPRYVSYPCGPESTHLPPPPQSSHHLSAGPSPRNEAHQTHKRPRSGLTSINTPSTHSPHDLYPPSYLPSHPSGTIPREPVHRAPPQSPYQTYARYSPYQSNYPTQRRAIVLPPLPQIPPPPQSHSHQPPPPQNQQMNSLVYPQPQPPTHWPPAHVQPPASSLPLPPGPPQQQAGYTGAAPLPSFPGSHTRPPSQVLPTIDVTITSHPVPTQTSKLSSPTIGPRQVLVAEINSNSKALYDFTSRYAKLQVGQGDTKPTRTSKVKASLIDDRIDILNRSAVEASPAKQVFTTISAILALVRDNTFANKDSIQLSEYCFTVCEVLKAMIQGTNADDLSGSVRTALEDLGRVMCEIERTLRRGANMPRVEYDKGKIEGHKLEIQEILSALNAPSSSLDENFSAGDRAPHDTTTSSISESACGRLIMRAFSQHELPSLVETIFASKDGGGMIRCLLEDDAQTFVDVIDEALDHPDIPPRTRRKCLKSLYRTCGRHALLPRALRIPVCYDRTGVALYRGGYADVWKGRHCDQDVAVKVIRVYSNSDLQKIIGRFCKEVVTWKTLRHPNVLSLIGVTMSENQFAMISDWMVNGNINDFVKAHPDANRLGLLGDVAMGLIYIHSQGMIHGDLKGANILIDQTCHARLADFGLLTVISDPANLLSSSSYTQGGTARWMSPELIAPQEFGFKNSCPTKASDCYSLGMVIYETISGNLPFHEHTDLAVLVKVLKGERPSRGMRFTKSLWKMLEQCWASQPNGRPSIEDILQCLEVSSNLPGSSSPRADEGMEDSGFEDTFDYSSPASSNDLSDQESESLPQASSVSFHSRPHHHSPSPPTQRSESLGFDSTNRSSTLLLADKPNPPSQKLGPSTAFGPADTFVLGPEEGTATNVQTEPFHMADLTHEGLQTFTLGHLMPRSSLDGENENWTFDPEPITDAVVFPTPRTDDGGIGQSSEGTVQNLSSSERQMLRIRKSTYVPGWSVPPRVLLVEDDAVSRKLSSKFLQIFGCTIDVAVDGIGAVNKVNLEKYDLVLMDIVMPKLDGVSATAMIRQFDHMTPIISMTSNSKPAEVMSYYASGMNDILPKPFTKERLFDMLDKHLMHLKVTQQHQLNSKVPRLTGISPMSDPSFENKIDPFAGKVLTDEEYDRTLQRIVSGEIFTDITAGGVNSSVIGMNGVSVMGKRGPGKVVESVDDRNKKGRFEVVD